MIDPVDRFQLRLWGRQGEQALEETGVGGRIGVVFVVIAIVKYLYGVGLLWLGLLLWFQYCAPLCIGDVRIGDLFQLVLLWLGQLWSFVHPVSQIKYLNIQYLYLTLKKCNLFLSPIKHHQNPLILFSFLNKPLLNLNFPLPQFAQIPSQPTSLVLNILKSSLNICQMSKLNNIFLKNKSIALGAFWGILLLTLSIFIWRFEHSFESAFLADCMQSWADYHWIFGGLVVLFEADWALKLQRCFGKLVYT